jgi:hypothetical protein
MFGIRSRVTVGLIAAGAVAGALFGVVLTIFGKILGGAPSADFANYVWNATVFGILAGIFSPLVTWAALRRAPLWRTVAEPLALAVAGGALGMAVGSGVLFLALPPAGLALGFAHLSRKYPQEPIGDQEVLPRPQAQLP